MAEDFEVTRGQALLRRYAWMDNASLTEGVEWLPVLHARALPGGPVETSAYLAWKAEIVAGLEALAAQGPLDGVLLDIHGAMSVVGMQDAEGDLATSVRATIGDDPLISAALDLHGNVSDALFAACDLLTCYRTAPHVDVEETRERAARNLIDVLVSGRGRPAKSLIHIPVLLPGEKTSTREQPAARIYALIWDARDQFEFVGPTGSMSQCLEHAEAADKPYFISDTGDNPGAGGAGDGTSALGELVTWLQTAPGRALFASILDPAAVAQCAIGGEGGEVDLQVGGHLDKNAPPVAIHGHVLALSDSGRGGLTAVVRSGALDLIITSNREQYAQLGQYLDAGVDPRQFDIVVVKIGYLEPDLHKMAADWMMALTPGGVDQDLARLGHTQIDRPMVPFDRVEAAELPLLLRARPVRDAIRQRYWPGSSGVGSAVRNHAHVSAGSMVPPPGAGMAPSDATNRRCSGGTVTGAESTLRTTITEPVR